MSSIVGRLSSPVKEDGTRDRVYLETCLKAVVDPTTGKTLDKVLTDMKEPLATELMPGLMSAEDKKVVNQLYSKETIMDSENPDRECTWIEVIEEDEEV